MHGHAARDQLVGQAPRVEQFEGPGVHPERPGDVGPVGAAFEQAAAGAAERDLARERQSGGARADDDDVYLAFHALRVAAARVE